LSAADQAAKILEIANDLCDIVKIKYSFRVMNSAIIRCGLKSFVVNYLF
jgi:hypothetical protein